MSSRLRDRFFLWIANLIGSILPESIRRVVLYDLADRVMLKMPEEIRDEWSITFEQMYSELRD